MSTLYHELTHTYDAMKKTLDHVMSLQPEILAQYTKLSCKKVFLTGCGTSFYQLRTLETLLAMHTDFATLAVPSGDALLNFDRYKKYLQDALVITVSRTGMKGEPVDLITRVKAETNAKVFGIISASDSKLKALLDYCIETPWAYDHWANQTRSIANHAAAYTAIVGMIANRPEIIDSLYALADKGNDFLARIEPLCIAIAKRDITNVMVLADSEACGLAEVGALMFDEIPFINAQYRHIMDSLHGPDCSLNRHSLVIALLNEENSDRQDHIVEMLQERTKNILLFKANTPSELGGGAEEVLFGTALMPETAGLPFMTMVIFIAYFMGVQRCVISAPAQKDFKAGMLHGVAY